ELGEGASPKKGGRKPILLSLNPSSKFVIGVDIGYTNMVVAIGNLKGECLAKIRVPTVHDHAVERVVNQVISLIDEMIREAAIQREKILGLGISVAGTVEQAQGGVIVFSPDFNWRQVAIAEIVEQKTGFTTIADNCTRVMTRGEIWYGHAQHVRNMFYINIGYGIGSAMVVDETIYPNHCECGHAQITTRDVRCYCGKSGCLEAVASGQAIERRANEMFAESDDGWMTPQKLADKAQQGNLTAQHIFAEAGRYIGRMTSLVANLFNPDTIIIGGGVALAGDLLLTPILKEFEENTMEGIKHTTNIEFSALGMDAGVLGAIALALNHFVFKQEMITRS
ncbi:ROK family protein, partial [candidate division KSB3 bacterium]|nr:ROK family protein [candidate division KSB3 bacterium]MBD3327526.1 ROK family protein [candidate division KSB3 bacterium]